MLRDARFFTKQAHIWRTLSAAAHRDLRHRTIPEGTSQVYSYTAQRSFLLQSRMPSQETESNTRPRSRSRSPIERKMPSSQSNPILRFAKLSENATAPTRGSALAAGYDLYSAQDIVVPAKGKEVVSTDIQIAVPDGCYGRVAPRSGLAAKKFIDVGAGVVDQDYRGNVGVVLFNFSNEDFKVSKGDRIAQLICERICYPDLEELPALDKTERNSGGFGSTGK
ncbi:deoxyuridine 5'-triphosphate nucleotidohydrolase [Elysia marginata]|uniref:Deoxyuridine 5'-triphosphate nucleotidohydrolase n=1 Tax=Elysia marginata TaxID=1093978 RepID=A0AAV4GCE2_9GAST|nr:deoxyuridine 5'-triphosphate nucleotidohydrolase [Elysia marginata]